MLDSTFELTPIERATLAHDLRVFATSRDDDAAQATAAGMAGIANVLARQAVTAREFADRLDGASYVRLGRVKSLDS